MTKKFTDWLDEGVYSGKSYWLTRPLKLKDGHRISIQASENHYCTPRSDEPYYDHYDEFEIGYPSFKSNLLRPFAEDPKRLTDTVYGCVPKEIIERVIKRHGGVVGFEE